MRINFRQGLISYTKDGTGAPQFLLASQTPGFISLIVSPTPVTATFAHGGSDYLQTFDVTVPTAWGPVQGSTPTYLYWDIDLLSAAVSYGTTVLEPTFGATPPPAVEDQHWFDTTTNKMRVWSAAANKWVERVRLFAGSVIGSQIIPQEAGSQVGLNVPSNAGYIMLDSLLRPFRTSADELLTTDTPVRIKTTSGTSGVLSTPPSAITAVRAAQNIPAMTLVYFVGENLVAAASSDPGLVQRQIPVGIIQQPLAANEIGNLSLHGAITYDQWDWSDSLGKPVYCNSYGRLTTSRPQGVLAYRIGTIQNHNTILLNIDAETFPQVYSQTANEVIIAGTAPVTTVETTNDLGERVVTISVAPSDPSQPSLLTPEQAAEIASIQPGFDHLQSEIDATNQSVTDLQSELDADLIDIQNKLDQKFDADYTPFDARYALIDHNHDGRYAPLVHTHEIVDVLGLQDALNAKADRTHLTQLDEVYTSVDRTGLTDVGTAPTLPDILDGLQTQLDNIPPGYTDAQTDARIALTPLSGIKDVKYTGVRAGGDVLSFDLGTGNWTNRTLPQYIVSVNGKTGTDIVLTTDDIEEGTVHLFFNEANFLVLFNSAISTTSINALVDVQTEYTDEHGQHVSPQDGQVLTWSDPISQWIPSTMQVNVTSVNSKLGDVVLTTTDVLEPEGDNPPNKYFTIGRTIQVMNDQPLKTLSDIDKAISPLPFDVLAWDGAKWTNLALPVAPVRMVCGYISDDFPSGNIALTTADITEDPSNLYWTQRRFDDAYREKKIVGLKDFAGTPHNGQFLAFSQPLDEDGNPTGDGYWVPTPAPGAPVTSVNNKTGAVVLTAADFGISSFYTTADFTTDLNDQFPHKINNTSITSLKNVAAGALDGEFLQYDAASDTWHGGVPPTAVVTSVATKTGDITLVPGDIVEPTTVGNATLIFFSAQRFKNNFQASSIADLADLSISNPQSNDTLIFNGTKWANAPVPSAPVLTVAGRTGNISLTTDDVGEGSNLYWTQTRFTNAFTSAYQSKTLSSLKDINGYSVANAGQYLKAYDNGDGTLHWGPGDAPGAPVTSVAGRTGAITLTTSDVAEGSNQYFTTSRLSAALATLSIDGFNDVTTTSPVTGQVLKWNGVQWVNDVVNISSSAVISALGYTPANVGGDSFTGPIGSNNTVTGTRFISTTATGTAPLTVASTTLVTNLNAQLFNSQSSTYYTDTYMTFAISDESTTPTVGSAKITFRAPYAITLTQIPRLSLTASGSSGLTTVDIKLAGTTILGSAKLSIDATEKTSVTAATPTTLAVTSIPDDGEITVDLNAIGTGATGLKVTLYFRKT